MEFGKLENIENVDFSLAPLSERSLAVLGGKAAEKLAVYVGCPVWGVAEWNGKIYPKGTKAADYLYHYSRQFATIELNVTHYRTPNDATLHNWKHSTAKDFLFCPKFPQEISHYYKLYNCQEKTDYFLGQVAKLGEKLGCMFIQLAPTFGISSLPILTDFLAKLPEHLPLAIEFRHPSWFAAQKLDDRACDLLESFDVATVITDVAGRRDVSHANLTNATAMIRFVGNELHTSDYQRIDEWVERIFVWKKQGLEKLYFFAHEPDNSLAPTIADYFLEKLNAKLELSVKRPTFLNEGLTLF
ncbi:MAG: DUF72 domain-containing protein [Bacteroidia bacterium]